MEKIKLRITGNRAEVVECPQVITSGTVGLPVEFVFDDCWANLDRLTVFRAGGMTVTVKNPAVVPWEVLEKPNVWLQIGVYGVNTDGTVVIPTLWASVCVIHTGADPGEGPAAEPTRTFWQEMREQIDTVKNDAVSKEAFYGHISDKGNPHGVTAAQVGAAPAGYISESDYCDTYADFLTKLQDIYDSMQDHEKRFVQLALTNSGNISNGELESDSWHIEINRWSDAYGSIIAIGDSYGECTLSICSGWQPWEWVNPIMRPGEEYRTTERVNGLAVYKKREGNVNYQRLDGETEWQEIPSPKTIVDTSNIKDYLDQDFISNFCPEADFYWHKYLDGTAKVYYMAQYSNEYGTRSFDDTAQIPLPFRLKDYRINVENYVEDERSTVSCVSNKPNIATWHDTFNVHAVFSNPSDDAVSGPIVDFAITITGRWK